MRIYTIALFLLFQFCFITGFSQQVIYVDSSANGANNGTSWANAFNDLQAGLAVADSLNEIWVAKGTYFPSDTNRLEPYIMKSGVSLYGGFNGTEISKSQRDWLLNKTILSGDIGVRGDSTDNSNKIVYANNLYSRFDFDGFVVENGTAVIDNPPNTFMDNEGGGIWANEADIIIRNCAFRNNYAGGTGGALWLNNGEATIHNCIFEYNTSVVSGGAIRTNLIGGNVIDCIFYRNRTIGDKYGNARAGAISGSINAIIDCIFRENYSFGIGGAAYMNGSRFINCLFEENSSKRDGGAVWIGPSAPSYIFESDFLNNYVIDSNSNGGAIYVDNGFGGAYKFEVYNSRFLNNNATRDGGALYLEWTKARVQNCEFVKNNSGRNGGAIAFYSGLGKCNINNCSFYNNNSGGSGKVIFDYATYVDSTKVKNCIFWNNGIPEIEYEPNSKPLLLSNSIIQSNYPGLNLQNTNPQFTNPQGADNILGTLDDDFRLALGSAAIDAGTVDTTGLSLVPSDLDDNPRINGIIDMGPYEYHDCNLTISNSNAGIDTSFCQFGYISLSAENPSVGVGQWNLVTPFGYFSDIYNPSTRVTNLDFGDNYYEWSVSYCGNVTRDTVKITRTPFPTKPVVDIIGPTAICPGDTTWLRLINPENGYTYQWNNGKTGDTIFITQGGSYRVTAYSNLGCLNSTSDNVNITAYTTPSKPIVTVTGNVNLCENSGETVTLRVSSSFPFYYWSNGATTREITIDTSGSFYVQVENSSGCFSDFSDTIQVNVNPNPAKPVLTQTGPSSFCNGDSVLVEGPTGFNTYSWSNGQTTSSIWIKQSQSVYLNVANSYGCQSENSDTLSFNVTGISKPSITVSGTLTFCTGGQVTLSAPLGFDSYQWSNGATTPQVFISQSGNYSVVVGNGIGCLSPSSDTITVTEVNPPSKPSITAQGPLTFCQGENVRLIAPAGFSAYQWSTGATTRSITVVNSGLYSVEVTNSNGCSSQVSNATQVTVHSNPGKPVINANGPISFCEGDSVELSVNGNYSAYNWSNQMTTPSIVAFNTGQFDVVVSNSDGCSSIPSDPVFITEWPIPQAPTILSSPGLEVCEGDTIQLTSTNTGGTINWNNGAQSESQIVTGQGTYYSWVESPNGCISDSSEMVETNILENPKEPQITQADGRLDGSLRADHYYWLLNGDYYSDEEQPAITTAGTYKLVVENNGCFSDTSAPYEIKCWPLEKEAGLSVYPNPVSKSLTISWVSDMPEQEIQVLLADVMGRTFLEQTIKTNPCKESLIKFNIPPVLSGIYFVYFKSGKKEIFEPKKIFIL